MFLRNGIKNGKTQIARRGKGFPGGFVKLNLELKPNIQAILIVLNFFG